MFGKRGYQYAAFNKAASIKHYSPDIHITLYTDDITLAHLAPADKSVFDSILLLEDKYLRPLGYTDPCNVKCSLYDLCPYDETIFLDVDGLCLRSMDHIFDEMKDFNYSTYVYDTHTIDKGKDFPSMIWAWCDEIWSHFNLPETAVLPATNSSIQFFRKCDETKILWDQVKANYKNKIPDHKLRIKWGGTQPDELYLNVALAQLGWKDAPVYMFLGDKLSQLSYKEIEEKYVFLSLYGGRGYTKRTYIDWYESRLRTMFRAKGEHHKYKVLSIINDKHCNNRKPSEMQRKINHLRQNNTPFLDKLDFQVSECEKIDSTKLIQGYKDPRGKTHRVTNWCNCSFIDYFGKIVFVYRMEGQPFCSYTKIGICELDENFDPLPETNKLLELHSMLKGYSKGFHVEDPRLFIHNDELYLSYCDGYQMGQAKINPETLEATESFYIKKPHIRRTEKNWTFFSHKDKIMSVYQIAPHTIYEMQGANWYLKHTEKLPLNWMWGEPRGGTSPVLTQDGYLSFFHSSIETKEGRQYYMGAYLFESEAPFAPLAISKTPIIGGQIIDKSIPRLNTGVWVVFPGGAIKTKDGWAVAFGSNDLECRIINVSDEYLNENMEMIIEMQTV